MTIVPRGDGFLPRYTEQELIDLYRKESDSKAKIRLLVAILRKDGKTLREISSRVKHPWSGIGCVACVWKGFPGGTALNNLGGQGD